MNTTSSQLTAMIGRLSRAVTGVVEECNYATRRMTEVNTAPDRYALDPDKAPDTYAEFLFRTSGVLAHEPSARARAQRGSRTIR
jgi:hypothetical protein